MNDNRIPYVFVPISKNQVVIVDADVAEHALSYTWSCRNGYASRCPKKGEAGFVRGSGKCGKVIYLHQVIIECPDGKEPDHINQNRFDDRRENLRCATRSQNMANRKGSANAIGYRGVSKNGGRYRALVRCKGEGTYLGNYETPEEAARAYDRGALDCFGEFATLNFPEAQ